jgi:hypothetical protein
MAPSKHAGTKIGPDGSYEVPLQEIQMTTMTMEELSTKLAKIDFCMLNSNGGSGFISSRPMSNNGDVEYDGDLVLLV